MRRGVRISLVLAVLMFLLPRSGAAQLLPVAKQYRIRRVDAVHNRLDVTYLTTENPVLYVLVDGNTHCLRGTHPMEWTDLTPGTVITVNGGLTFDLHVKARTITVEPSP